MIVENISIDKINVIWLSLYDISGNTVLSESGWLALLLTIDQPGAV
jgi:hypothetical protein